MKGKRTFIKISVVIVLTGIILTGCFGKKGSEQETVAAETAQRETAMQGTEAQKTVVQETEENTVEETESIVETQKDVTSEEQKNEQVVQQDTKILKEGKNALQNKTDTTSKGVGPTAVVESKAAVQPTGALVNQQPISVAAPENKKQTEPDSAGDDSENDNHISGENDNAGSNTTPIISDGETKPGNNPETSVGETDEKPSESVSNTESNPTEIQPTESEPLETQPTETIPDKQPQPSGEGNDNTIELPFVPVN